MVTAWQCRWATCEPQADAWETQLAEGGQITLSPKARVGSPLLGNVDTHRNTWPVLATVKSATVKSDHLLGPQTFALEPDLLRTAGPLGCYQNCVARPCVDSPLLDNPACLQRPKEEPPALLKLQGAKALLGSLNSEKPDMLFIHANVVHHQTGFTPHFDPKSMSRRQWPRFSGTARTTQPAS